MNTKAHALTSTLDNTNRRRTTLTDNLTTELVVRAPTAFEISTADNVYMDQEIRSRITHIKAHLSEDAQLKTHGQPLAPLFKELDAFLTNDDNRTWSKLADDVTTHLSALSDKIRNRIHNIVMVEVLTHRRQACEQHEALIAAYKHAGLKVTRLPDHPGSDAVFATDTGEQVHDFFLLGNLKNPRRHGEERCTLELLKKRKISVKCIPGLIIEGGDLIYSTFYKVLFVGEGFRNTDHPAKKIAAEFPHTRVIPVGLTKAEHYHLDCCFMVLSGGEILVYEDAITPSAFDEISQLTQDHRAPSPFALSQSEALNFGSNLVCVDQHIFHATGSLSESTLQQLKTWGYSCHAIDYDALHRSGGSIRCSTLAIRPSVGEHTQ